MTAARLQALTTWLAVALAASVPVALFATRASRVWTVRVAMAALVVGAMCVVASSLARALRDIDPRHRVVNAVAATVALSAVVFARTPDALAVLVAAPSAWLLAQSIGVVRVPGSGVHYAASAWNAARWLLTALAFVVAMTFKLFPDTARSYVGRVFGARTNVGVTWPDGGLRHIGGADAAVPFVSRRTLVPLDRSTEGSHADVETPTEDVDTMLPHETPEGVLRWLANEAAARHLQQKISDLRARDHGARFVRTISRAGECGFVVTYSNGSTEGWVYNATDPSLVVRGPIPWVLTTSPSRTPSPAH